MKKSRWSLSATALCVFALSVYGCSSESAADDDDDTSSSSGGGKTSSSGGRSSSSGGRSSSSGGRSSSSGGGSSSGDESSSGEPSSSGSPSSSGEPSSSGSPSSSGQPSSSSGGPQNCVAITPADWELEGGSGTGFLGIFEADGLESGEVFFGFPPNVQTGQAQNITLDSDTAVQGFASVSEEDGFFIAAESGTATITSFNKASGSVDAVIANITLVEATVNQTTGAVTKVPNGRCFTIASSDIDVVGELPTPGWTCDFSFYGDDSCDCGCGAADIDCDGATTIAACEFCLDCGGAPNGGGCEGKVNPGNILQCVAP